MNEFCFYIDESCHLEHDHFPVMCVGAVRVPSNRIQEYKERLKAIKEKYGILRCSREELSALPPEAVIGRKETAYGVEAIAARDAVPAGLSLSPIDIEELFIFMVKGANPQ